MGRCSQTHRICTRHDDTVDDTAIDQLLNIRVGKTDTNLIVSKPDLHSPCLSISVS